MNTLMICTGENEPGTAQGARKKALHVQTVGRGDWVTMRSPS